MGPGDLSGAMGHVGDLMHPEVVALMADGVSRCHRAGKPVGTVGGTPEAVATYRAAGFDYIGCASDLGLMMRNCASVLSAIRFIAKGIEICRRFVTASLVAAAWAANTSRIFRPCKPPK
jgi:hypothetical protein